MKNLNKRQIDRGNSDNFEALLVGGGGGGGLGISYIPLIFGQNIPYPVNFGGLYLQLLCSISLNFLLKYPVSLKFFTQISRIPNGVFNVIFSADICTMCGKSGLLVLLRT